MNKKLEKRVPIRTHVLILVMQVLLLTLLPAFITGIFCIHWVQNSLENIMDKEFEGDIKKIVEQKSVAADARLEHYEKYIEFVTDYISGMYEEEEEMIARGSLYFAPRDTKEYALTRGYSSEDMKAEDFTEQLLFFSNLEQIWEPIAKANENLITTVYAGTTTGLLTSYDRWSYLSVPEEGKELIYDFFQSGWYTQGLKEDGVFYTGLYTDSQGRGLTITVASPFRNAEGEIMGVDCADFDITGLYDELLSVDLGPGTFSFALDADGALISPGMESVSIEEYTGLSADELAALTAEPDGILELRDAVYVCVPIERVGWTLCVSVPMIIIQNAAQEADQYILYAILTFLGVFLLIGTVAVFAVNRVASNITHPMELLCRDMQIISDGDLEYRATVYRNDEIGDITSQMNEMVDRLKFTMSELMSSQQYADAMSELATRDSLTGVYNKTAFDEKVRALEEDISDGSAAFGLVMVDLNNLKMINDNYGHSKGDRSIRKICGHIGETFSEFPVYRIGGDEFVVVLDENGCRQAESLVGRFQNRVAANEADSSLDPWEQVTAAIGYALFDAAAGDSVQSVLVRADRQMYRNKGDHGRI